jgi:threonine dehydratase
VFSIPSRSAVYAENYDMARLTAAATSDPSRKVAKQAFMLFPKIREIDCLLRERHGDVDPPWRERVFEVHPELAFWRLNGEKPLLHPKKAKSGHHQLGRDERVAILVAAGIPGNVLARTPPRGAAIDDMLDALAALCVARRIHAGKAKPFPDPPARDDFGLPIAIWA